MSRFVLEVPPSPTELPPAPLGLRWSLLGDEPPADGVELTHPGLSSALERAVRDTVDFSPRKWAELGVGELSEHAYIRVATVFFAPLAAKPTPPPMSITPAKRFARQWTVKQRSRRASTQWESRGDSCSSSEGGGEGEGEKGEVRSEAYEVEDAGEAAEKEGEEELGGKDGQEDGSEAVEPTDGCSSVDNEPPPTAEEEVEPSPAASAPSDEIPEKASGAMLRVEQRRWR